MSRKVEPRIDPARVRLSPPTNCRACTRSRSWIRGTTQFPQDRRATSPDRYFDMGFEIPGSKAKRIAGFLQAVNVRDIGKIQRRGSCASGRSASDDRGRKKGPPGAVWWRHWGRA